MTKLNCTSAGPQANFLNSHASPPNYPHPSSNFHQHKHYHHPNFQPHQTPRSIDGHGFRSRLNFDNDFDYSNDQFHPQDDAR
jgi:hypothetical protein